MNFDSNTQTFNNISTTFYLGLIFFTCTLPLFVRTAYAESLYDYSATTLENETISLAKFRGKVLLVSNIALKCATTPQLSALQTLFEKFGPRGFVILGFPSNDFTGKEPNEAKEILSTCEKRYGVKFPLFVPGPVTGPRKQSVFSYLTSSCPEEDKGEVGFNFEKFLIDKHGKVRARYGPFTGAMSDILQEDVENLLKE